MSPRSTTLPLYVWNCGSNSEFCRWHKSITVATWTLLLIFLCLLYDLLFVFDFLQLPSWQCLKLLPFLVHCCLCIWNLHCLVHWNEFVHYIVIQFRILSFTCNVLFMTSSFSLIQFFVSWIHVLQQYNWTLSLLQMLWLFQVLSQRFPGWWLGRTLCCIASRLPLVSPTFVLHSWWCLCNLHRLDHYNKFPFQFLASSSMRFSIAHSCFSRLWVAFPILVQASGHVWSGRDVVWIFVSLPVSTNCVNLLKPVHESDKLLFSSTFQWSSIRFFLCNVQICTSRPGDINILQVLVNSCIIFCFFRLKLFPIAMRFSAEILSPYGGFLSQSGFLDFVVIPDKFAEPCATRNTKNPSFWVIRTSFAFSLPGSFSDASNFCNSSKRAIRISLFQILSR